MIWGWIYILWKCTEVVFIMQRKSYFLSDKLLESNSDFEISHELGHCIKKHEELSAYYNATDYSRRKLEFEANQIAIEILLLSGQANMI